MCRVTGGPGRAPLRGPVGVGEATIKNSPQAGKLAGKVHSEERKCKVFTAEIAYFFVPCQT